MVNDKTPEQIVENLVNNDKRLKAKYSTGRKLSNFKVGDIVYCTFIKGLFKVIDKKPKSLVLSNIITFEDNIFIIPEFVDKVNKDTVKVLYDV